MSSVVDMFWKSTSQLILYDFVTGYISKIGYVCEPGIAGCMSRMLTGGFCAETQFAESSFDGGKVGCGRGADASQGLVKKWGMREFIPTYRLCNDITLWWTNMAMENHHF